MADTFDVNIGANVRRLRESIGLSQAGLAARVMARAEEEGAGPPTPFRQQLIDRIERGARPLRLHEALALADALGCSLDVLCEQPGEVIDLAVMVRGLITRHEVAVSRLESAVTDVLTSQVALQSLAGEREGQLPEDVVAQVKSLAGLEVGALVRHVVANYQEPGEVLVDQWPAWAPSRFDSR